MKANVIHNEHGYTLIEALVSMSILLFIVMCTYGVLGTGNAITTKDNALVEMQAQVRNGMDRMLREIRQSSAQTITVVNANSDIITFTIPTATGIKYYLSGTNLVREYPSGTVNKIAYGIAYLKFTLSSKLLTISMRGDKAIYTTTVSYPLVEKVRLRNE